LQTKQYANLLCENAGNYPKPEGLADKLESLNRILGSILITSQRKNPISYLLSFFIF